ncbi:MAG: hypothetical protein ACI3X9_01825, partial [Bacteroidaceae bacterium]
PWRGNLLSAQGRMERSGMAPWVSETDKLGKRPERAKAGLRIEDKHSVPLLIVLLLPLQGDIVWIGH